MQWFNDHHLGLLAGFGVVFLISGMTAPMNALLAYSMRRMSVSRLFAYSYLVIYSLAAIPGMVVMAEPLDTETPDEGRMDAGTRMDLNAALETLSAAERTCVTLCHGAGLTGQEIADALDVPLGTVKSHVTRGLEKLRWRLYVDRKEPHDR